MKTMKMRIAAFLSAMILLVGISIPTGFRRAFAAGRAFDSTDIMADLESIEGFSRLKYPSYPSLDPTLKVIDFVEYCYDGRNNMRDNYALYLYVYNPNGIDIDEDSLDNHVTLAVAYDSDPVTEKSAATKWDKFDLIYCARSSDEVFYKFRVLDHRGEDGKTVAERVNPQLRRYDVSELEIMTEGDRNATAYRVATAYHFEGFAEGYGETAYPLRRETLTTVSLDLHHTAYRFPYINENGAGHQNQLDSVYFAVPKGFQEEYGELYRVTCSWNEQKTASVIVTNRQEIYDDVATHLGTDGSGANYGIFDNLFREFNHLAAYADWGYNPGIVKKFDSIPDDPTNYYIEVQSTTPYVGYVFLSNKSNVMDEYISSKRMKEWIYSHDYADYLFTDAVDEGRKKGKQESTFTADEPFDMLTFNQTANGWDKFCLNWEAFWTGKKWDFGPEQQAPVDPIRHIVDDDFTGTDIADAGKLYVHTEDFNEFKTFYETNKAKNDVFLLRFAVTDYYSRIQTVWQNNSLNPYYSSDSTFMARETVFLDFDVISLTFLEDTTETVIPAAASPIDAVGSLEGPDGGGTAAWVKWTGVALSIIGIILLIVLLWPVMPHVIQGLVWVVSAPIKLVGWTIDAIKADSGGKKASQGSGKARKKTSGTSGKKKRSRKTASKPKRSAKKKQ